MNKFDVSFFCPAYNDEDNLLKLIPTVHKFLSEISDRFEIIIIEDGSPDRTGEIAEQLAQQHPYIRVIHHSKNLGYGATLKDGFKNSKYDYIMYTDGDNQYDVNEFAPALPLLKNVDIISGFAIKKAVNFRRKVQSQLFNGLIKILFGVNLRDINCSMKIYAKKTIDAMDIKSNSAFIDAEMLVRARKNGFSVAQFPVTHYERECGIASGSKFNVIADTIKDMLKFRLGLL